MCRIAKQRDPPEGPSFERIAIDHRILVTALRRPDQTGHVEPLEPPAREVRKEVPQLAWPVPVLAAPLVIGPELAFDQIATYCVPFYVIRIPRIFAWKFA